MDIFEDSEEPFGEEPWHDRVINDARKDEAERINRLLIENGTVAKMGAQHVRSANNEWGLAKIKAFAVSEGVSIYLEFVSSQSAVAGANNETLRKNLETLIGRTLTLASVEDSFRMVYLSVNF